MKRTKEISVIVLADAVPDRASVHVKVGLLVHEALGFDLYLVDLHAELLDAVLDDLLGLDENCPLAVSELLM